MKINNKKGFTLIELIAVIIIIGLIALIAIPFFTGSFEDFKKNFYTNLSTTMLNSGKEFFADNSKYLPRRYLYSQKVSLATLKDKNYLKSFKDYKGGECDLLNSYIIVIKKANKIYDYAVCLICPNDSYENLTNKYCDAAWDNNDINVTYELGDIATQYVYKGTAREVLREKLKITLDVVKYNAAGEEIARVSGEGEEGIGVVYPSNLDTVDTNRVGEYPLQYTYQGTNRSGLAVVYENSAPIVVANKNQNIKDKSKVIESDDTIHDTSEYDNSTNGATPNDTWAQKLVYNMSSGTLTEPGLRVTEYQWYIRGRWETFCKTPEGSSNCSKTLADEMNEVVKFRSLDTNGNFGAISREYTIRIDTKNPQCTLNLIDLDPDGTNNWYVNDFDVYFKEKKDTSRTVYEKNVASGLAEENSTVILKGVVLNTTGVFGEPSARQTEDSESFTWFGYIEDKAGNWNRCYNRTASGTTHTLPESTNILKKDNTPPTCSLKVTQGEYDSGGFYTGSSIKIGFNTKIDVTSKVQSYGIGLTTAAYDNSTEYTYNRSASNESVVGVVKDYAGNTNSCSLAACSRQQKKTRSAATCVCDKTYSYSGTCSCNYVPQGTSTTITLSSKACNERMYNNGGCEAYCKTQTFTSGYTVVGKCERSESNVTCTDADICGYTSWSSWREDTTCTSQNCTGTKCCRKVYKVGTSCGASAETTFTASFDGNGGTYTGSCGTAGTCSVPDVSCTTSTGSCNITLPANAYSRNNKTFVGWNTDRNATTGSTAGSSVSINSNRTYYAIWSDDTETFTATFDGNGATSGSTANVTCTVPKSEFGVTSCEITLPANGFSRTGYTFNGWGLTESATTIYYPSGTFTVNGSSITFDGKFNMTENKNFYAQWTLNSYTCTAGNYLPAGATSCSTCTANNYCSGGTFPYNPTTPQGLTACPTGYTSSAGQSAKTGCSISCSKDKRVNIADAQCTTNCASGYTIAAHTVIAGNTSPACTIAGKLHTKSGEECSPNNKANLEFSASGYITDTLEYSATGGTISCKYASSKITCSLTIDETRKTAADSHAKCKCAFKNTCAAMTRTYLGKECGAIYYNSQCWLGSADSPVWNPSNSSDQSDHDSWCASSLGRPRTPGKDHHCPRTADNGHHYCASSSNNCVTSVQYNRSATVAACLCMEPKGAKNVYTVNYSVKWRATS